MPRRAAGRLRDPAPEPVELVLRHGRLALGDLDQPVPGVEGAGQPGGEGEGLRDRGHVPGGVVGRIGPVGAGAGRNARRLVGLVVGPRVVQGGVAVVLLHVLGPVAQRFEREIDLGGGRPVDPVLVLVQLAVVVVGELREAIVGVVLIVIEVVGIRDRILSIRPVRGVVVSVPQPDGVAAFAAVVPPLEVLQPAEAIEPVVDLGGPAGRQVEPQVGLFVVGLDRAAAAQSVIAGQDRAGVAGLADVGEITGIALPRILSGRA